MSVPSLRVTVALALVIAAGISLSACGGAVTPRPSSAPPASAPAATGASTSTDPEEPSATATDGAQGGRVSCEPLGAPAPRYTVDLPPGWEPYEGECGFVVLPADRGLTAGLSAWIVGSVPTDPCRSRTALVSPKPGVDGLVAALLGQQGRNPTAPEAVSLAGHDGVYLEWSVPDGVRFVDGMEFHAVGCDDQSYLSWNGRAGGTRYQQAVRQVDRLWVLDVDGETVVVDASHAGDAPQTARDQLQALVDSLEFERP